MANEIAKALLAQEMESLPIPGTFTPQQPNISFGERMRGFSHAISGDIQDSANSVASALMAPGNALQGQYNQVEINPDGSVNPVNSALIEQALNMSANFMGAGSVVPKPTGSLGIVGGNLAKSLDMETLLPQTPEFTAAVSGTPGAKITPDGLSINLTRYQPPQQGGAPAIRTGVFYLPEGASQLKYYKGGKSGYGGSEKISGEAVIRRPLVVKGATGGKAPQVAYDTIMGKGAFDAMRTDILRSMPYGRNMTPAEIARVLEKYGADPDMAYEIADVTSKTGGNTLPYAIQENIIAHAIRGAGYDAMVGYSTGKQGPFISEVFDVREVSGPINGVDPDIHYSFEFK